MHSNGWHSCYRRGADVRTFNGIETVLCREHAGRLDAVRESEKNKIKMITPQEIPPEALQQMQAEGWPSIEDQRAYWQTHDHGGNVLPDRIAANHCRYCEEHEGDSMMPPHTASVHCESGRRNHCTCDICY